MIPQSVAAPGEWDGEEPAVAFRFRLMSQADAAAIARWHYPAPFSFYDWTSDPDDLDELLDRRREATISDSSYYPIQRSRLSRSCSRTSKVAGSSTKLAL